MSSQNNPLITIGITAYNAAATLPRAVECALGQNWQNKEIIIVDDCSTDATPDVIQEYQKLHPDLRYIRNDINQGVAASRNKIIQAMKGSYLAFFDDDDISTADRIEKQFLRLKNFSASEIAICHTARAQLYPDGTTRIEQTPGGNNVPNGMAMFDKILLGRPVDGGFGSLATCSVMMPKSVIDKIGLYDDHFRRCEDTDYTLRFALAGGYFLGIGEPLVTQTMNITSEKTLSDEHKYHTDIYLKYRDTLGECKTDFALSWLNLRYEFLYHRYGPFLWIGLKLFFKHPVLVLRKLSWALPNLGFNISIRKLHKESA